jgi:NADH-quinone oxidoreductase subunit J
VPPPLVDLLFAACAVGLLAFSLAVVLAKNPVRSTLLLILSFLPTALLYVMLQAPFVGILQILVYAGAIMMLFVFVIMMINPAPKSGEIPGDALGTGSPKPAVWKSWAMALLLGFAGFAVLPPIYWAASEIVPAAVSKPGFGGLHSLADLIFRDPGNNPLTLSFELISVLILVGIIAAINFSRRRAAAEPTAPPAGKPSSGTS